MNKENAWLSYSDEQKKELEQLASSYRQFLDNGKTERECVVRIVEEAKKAGYHPLSYYREHNKVLQPGDRVYEICMNKTIALFQIGSRPLEEGMRILGAHIDSPRLDLKQNPLYENTELAYLDTHYYGGIKKYQWVTLPLALHGVVAKKDGSVIPIVIGEEEADPVVYISDLLPHLASKQIVKKGSVVVEGEALDVLVGSIPSSEDADEKKERVKATILQLLESKYNITEDDFLSAEIEVVPAGKARDCGLDRSMIAAYGQDDRVCAYTSFLAMLEAGDLCQTACCLLVDKEEIGSVGATGMQSRFFENAVAELLDAMGQYSEFTLRRALRNSCMLSSDVSAAYDPQYSDVFEKRNSAYFGKGIVINKYTGSRGKSGSNDANAEYIAKLRLIFDSNNVAFQTAELGKVDAGGGGTIAYISALYGMDVIDSGVAVLSMHAPWEVTSKADIYEAKKAYSAFLNYKG